ncbi:MAG: hypothetical protein R3F34_07190 [Planctomycetota bacterium]
MHSSSSRRLALLVLWVTALATLAGCVGPKPKYHDSGFRFSWADEVRNGGSQSGSEADQ